MLTFNIWKDPYDSGVSLTHKTELTFDEGITILVGCNGSGKSTLLQNIKSECRKNKIPYYYYDNMSDGRNTMSALIGPVGFGDDDMTLFSDLYSSSEGESVKKSLAIHGKQYTSFINEGKTKNALERIFLKDEKVDRKERVFLLDGIDSGLSIDSIAEVVGFLKKLEHFCGENGYPPYIIVSANNYEMCPDFDCLDVVSGNPVNFSSYNQFKKYIEKTRKEKEKRIEKEISIGQKRYQKALLQAQKKCEKAKENIGKILASDRDEKRKKYDIDSEKNDLRRSLKELDYISYKEIEEMLEKI